MKKRMYEPDPYRVILVFLLLLLFPVLEAQDPGFFLDDWQKKNAVFPDSEPVDKPAGAATVTISVDMDHELNRVPQYIYGNNAVTWGGNMNEHATIMTDINNLDPHVLRWPGGNLSQEYFWNLTSDQRPIDIPDDAPNIFNARFGVHDNNWEMSTDDYYDLLSNTNSTGSICVNYSYARYGTSPDPVSKAAHLAAEWVRYDNGRSKFWEIGNENFGSWEAGYEIDVTKNQDGQPRFINGQLYGQHCRIFIDSMRAAAAETGADIKIGVVAYDAESSHDPIQTVWNEGMMPEVGDYADFLIVHSYFTPYNENSTVSTILNSHHVAVDIMDDMVDDMAEAVKPMIPVAFTEWNIFAVGSMQQVSYIAGMHAALVLGEFIKTDYGLATRWDLTNAWAGGNDHGMFSRAGEPGVDHYNPRPAFFYMYYFQEYFGDRMVNSSVSGNNSVIAYASSYTSGESGMVIINKSTSAEIVSVELDNFERGTQYYYHTLTGGTDNGDFSRKVFLNGIGTDEAGGGPDDYENVKAYSAETEGGITVALPPLSTVYLMIENNPQPLFVSAKVDTSASVINVDLSMAVMLSENPGGFSVFANGAVPIAVAGIEVDTANAHRISLLLGSEVLPTDKLTLSYSGGDVLSLDSAALAPFSDMPVENLLPGATPLLNNAFTTMDGMMINLIFNMDMKVSGAPVDSLVLTINDERDLAIGIAEIHVDSEDSTRIIITPEESLFAEYNLTLSYSGTGLLSKHDAHLEPFDSIHITNHSPGLPPQLISAEVSDLGFAITAQFDKSMNDLSGYSSLYTVHVDDELRVINSIHSTGNIMTISLADHIRFEEIIVLGYEGTAALAVDRGILESFENFPVVNTMPGPTVVDIPGMIEAEVYTINMGMVLEPCADVGGGFELGNIDPGGWLEFEVNVLKTGVYTGHIRISSYFNGRLLIQTPDAEAVNQDTVYTTATGGFQQWESFPVEISLMEGRQRLKITAMTPGLNINWLNLEFDRPIQVNAVSAATNESGDTIKIVFDKELAVPGEGEHSGFSVQAGGNAINVTQLSLNNDLKTNLLLALETKIPSEDEMITVSYETGNLMAADSTPVAFFTSMPVTNQVITDLETTPVHAISFYPNPANDRITIESNMHNITGVEVVDITGNRIIYKELSSPLQTVTMDLNIPRGVYLIRISSDSNMFCSKLITY